MIAAATTTITVLRGVDPSNTDPWERDQLASTPKATAVGVGADIGIATGRSGGPGDTQTVEFSLACNPCDLTFRDTVVDDRTGETYAVQWASLDQSIPGLEHVVAGLQQVTGYGNK